MTIDSKLLDKPIRVRMSILKEWLDFYDYKAEREKDFAPDTIYHAGVLSLAIKDLDFDWYAFLRTEKIFPEGWNK